jgi:2-isopropylmalate synthase
MEIAGRQSGECYGVGVDSNIVTASIKALLSGVNRLGAAQMRESQSKAA